MPEPAPWRKRKERDEDPPPPPGTAAGGGGNRLLAGYLAHEFLTRGTLLGQRLTGPAGGQAHDEAQLPPAGRAYDDVAALLKSDGAHVPGVLNPTQLGRWIRSPVAQHHVAAHYQMED